MKTQGWRVAIGLGMMGAIGFSASMAGAQSVIVPDGTLGGERSQVEFRATSERITGGAERGINLFHSFREFNVGEGRSTYFIAPNTAIENILARVTGQNPSEILGRLGTAQLVNGGLGVSNANLFLINPNGIVFGRNASLDVDRSLAITTASGIQFGDRGTFSATQPEIPAALLTINPSVFLFNQSPVGNIVVRANQPIAIGSSTLGLRVPNGQSLTLLGGDVALEGGRLNAWGGRVEIGAVAAPGQVAILPTGALGLAAGLARGNVDLTSGARVDVQLRGGGEIGIAAGNIRLAGGSQLLAGIDTVGGTATSRAGDVRLDATGTILLEGASRIQNDVSVERMGNAGNVAIAAAALEVTDGSQLSASTSGTGDAGNVLINVRDRVVFTGTSPNGQFASAASSSVGQGGVGKGGNVSIQANSLEVANGAQLIATTRGTGDAGNVLINVRDRAFFNNGNAFSSVDPGGVGKGGNVSIQANSLEVANGAQLIANTRGRGDAGNVLIDVRDRVVFTGTSPNGQFVSAAFSSVAQGGAGKGGNVSIQANSLEVANGAQLIATTEGTGDAGNVLIDVRDRAFFNNGNAFSRVEQGGAGKGGNVSIQANSLEVANGAQLTASTFGTGDAGNVLIDVRDRVVFTGTSPNGQFASAAFSSVGQGGAGKGGNVSIQANSLEVANGARLTASTSGTGDAGNVLIEVRDRVVFTGTSPNGQFASAALSSVRQGGAGKGGNVSIQANSLEVANGAGLTSSTSGTGDAGNVLINVRDRVVFTGTSPNGQFASAAFSSVEQGSVGKGGNVSIQANSLEVANGARLVATTSGTGDAGNILIDVQGGVRLNNGLITTEAAQAAGGEIRIAAQTIRLLGNSDIRTSVFSGVGGGGNVTLTADSIIALGDSDILAFARDGKGGNVTLNTPAFFGQNYRPAPLGTDPLKLDGNNRVDINTSGTVFGIITLPDLGFLQNGLNQLPNPQIDTNALLANSCIVRTPNRNNSFYVTGSSSLPLRPGDPPAVPYPTGELRATGVGGQGLGVSSVPRVPGKRWQKGDPIVEPDGIYQLPDGQLILSRECTSH